MRIPRTPPRLDETLATHADRLSLALLDPEYQRLVRQCELDYLHWDKARHLGKASEGGRVEPALLWALVEMQRMGRSRALPLFGAKGERVHFQVPAGLQREIMLIDRELGGALIAADERPLDASQKERFIINALREEAIASSMLEGAATTRRVAKEMLRSGRSPRNRGEQMVLNNYRAIELAREHRDEPLTPEFVIELQSVLTTGTLDHPDQAGRLRRADEDVVISTPYNEVLFEPPPAGELPGRLRRLCDFANARMDEDEFVHPVIRACALHFQLGVDHPFCDGNGRTARILFYWCMLSRGYWLFEFLPISRLIYRGPGRYSRAYLYSETDRYDLTYFLMYHAKILAQARREFRQYIKEKQQEIIEARAMSASDSTLNHRQRELVLEMTRDPTMVTTIAEYQGSFQVAYATANTDLEHLVDQGYLIRTRSGKKYEFRGGPKLGGDRP